MIFCENTALETICELVPHEHRYLQSCSNLNTKANFNLFCDENAIMFITSLLRIQLETSVLKNLTSKDAKLNRNCFSKSLFTSKINTKRLFLLQLKIF